MYLLPQTGDTSGKMLSVFFSRVVFGHRLDLYNFLGWYLVIG